LALDYTNNYGLRPFFPFDKHWYAASIVFIFDPLIFALLLLALVVPSIFRLIGAEVGARRQPFPARGWALAALFGVAGIWAFRFVEHGRAVQLAMAESFTAPPSLSATGGSAQDKSGLPSDIAERPVFLSPQRVLASPDPLSPFRWYTASDFGNFYQLGQADTRSGALVSVEGIFSKPRQTAAVLAAERSWLGRVYLDWSPMPIITVTRSDSAGSTAEDASPTSGGLTQVTFQDPRFMGGVPLLHSGTRGPLSGTVELDSRDGVVMQEMDGRIQR
jgi:inner membrane protein